MRDSALVSTVRIYDNLINVNRVVADTATARITYIRVRSMVFGNSIPNWGLITRLWNTKT